MTFSIREPIRQWLERIDAAVTALQTSTSGLIPTSGQKDALTGTSGTPSSSNKYVTDGDSRNTNSRAPSGSAGGSVGGTFPSSLTVTKLDETSGPTALTIGAVADGSYLKRSGSTVIGGSTGPLAADITSQINPLHWWRADNVTTVSGKVSDILDNGSSAKNFSQVTAGNRATAGTNGNGNTYLTMSAAATTYYQAGVTSDWTYAHNGTGTTLAIVMERTALATAGEDIVGTGSGNFTLRGFGLAWAYTSSVVQGPGHYVVPGNSSTVVSQVVDTGVQNTLQIIIVRFVGVIGENATLATATTQGLATVLRRQGSDRAFCNQNATARAVTAPNNTLLLGQAPTASGASYFNGRFYELVHDNRAWTDTEIRFYEQYVGNKYALSGFNPRF